MDRIREMLANLASLTDEQVAELRTLISAEFDAASADETPATAESVAAMSELLEARRAVAALVTERAEAAQAAAAERDRIKAEMAALDAEPEETPEAGSADAETPPADAETPPADGTPATADAETPPADAEAASPLLTPVAASAPRGTVAESMVPRMAQTHGTADPAPEVNTRRHGSTVVAAAGVPHFAPGQELTSDMELARAMSDRLQRMSRSRDRQEALVASVQWTYPEERQLGPDAAVNTARIEAVCGLKAGRFSRDGALVATGGVCLPVNVDYSVPTWSTADRPLRDALPAFQATRGGVRFVTPPDIGTPSLQSGGPTGAGAAAGVWTEATDANPSGATKPVWTVACGSEQLVYVNAITTRVQFGNMQSRFAPEQIAANTQQAIAITAREAELELLTLLAAHTTQVTPQQYLGATRDLLASIDLLRAQYVYSHRFDPNVALTAVFPMWAKDLLRADIAREVAHDNAGAVNVLAITDAQLEEWFTVRGINPVWTLDALEAGTYGTGGTAITAQNFTTMATNNPQPQWPGQTSDGNIMLVWFLFVEGTFQFLDGGQLDLGVVRDSVLDATNDYETFSETFEGVAFRGIEAYQVHSLVKATGGSAGTVAGSSYHE